MVVFAYCRFLFSRLTFYFFLCVGVKVVGILEEEVPDLVEVPKPLEHASVVGDHLNFHLVNPTEEENKAFQVHIVVLISGVWGILSQ